MDGHYDNVVPWSFCWAVSVEGGHSDCCHFQADIDAHVTSEETEQQSTFRYREAKRLGKYERGLHTEMHIKMLN